MIKARKAVYCLFDTGEAVKVNVDVYDNDSSDPVRGFFQMNGSGGFAIAAERAAGKVYTALKANNLSVGRYSAMFDLSMEEETELLNIGGQSGGLSFALALASELTGTEHPEVAATGIIEADGTISLVKEDDFKAKLDGACRVLSNGGLILYPEKNQVPGDTRLRLVEKGIGIIPVNSIAQALRLSGISPMFFPKRKAPFTPFQKKKRYAWILSVALLAMILLWGLLYIQPSSKPEIKSMQSNLPSAPLKLLPNKGFE